MALLSIDTQDTVCSTLHMYDRCVTKPAKQPLTGSLRLDVVVAQGPAFLGSALGEVHAIQVHVAQHLVEFMLYRYIWHDTWRTSCCTGVPGVTPGAPSDSVPPLEFHCHGPNHLLHLTVHLHPVDHFLL